MKPSQTIITVLLLAILGSAHSTVLAQEQQDAPSLYERLGGIYPIAAVVDDFIERLLVNDVLNANAAINEARMHVPKAGLKYRVTELVGQVTGGPQMYSGRSMKESHAHLNITEGEWQAMMDDFKATLAEFARRFWGPGTKVRFRPSFFPFTEPSAEVDVKRMITKKDGTRVESDWIEIMGSGMVDPNVLENVNLDSERYTGFAFGMGPARMALLKYGVPDLRESGPAP